MMLDQDLDFVCQAGAEGCDSRLQKGNEVLILCSCSGLRINSQHLCVELRWNLLSSQRPRVDVLLCGSFLKCSPLLNP